MEARSLSQALVVAVSFLATLLSGELLPPGEIPKLPAGPAAEALVPASTLVHVTIDGSAAHPAAQGLALAQIARDPEMQRFLAPLKTAWPAFRKRFEPQIERMLGRELAELLPLLRTRLSVSLLGLREVRLQQAEASFTVTVPDLVFVWELGTAAPVVGSILPRLEAMAVESGYGEASDQYVAGVTVRVLEPENAHSPKVIYVLHADRLLVATTIEAMADVLRRLESPDTLGSLASAPAFIEAMKNVRGPTSLVRIFADVRALLRFAPEEAAPALRVSGIDAIVAAGYGLSIDGPSFRDRLWLGIPERRGYWAAFRPEAGPPALDRLAPAETVLMSTSVADVATCAQALLDMAGAIEPGGAELLAQMRSEAERRIGFNIIDGLLAHFGPECGLYAALPGQALIPDIAFVVQVKDQATVEKALTAIAGALGEQVTVRETTFRGAAIRYAEIGGVRQERGLIGLPDIPPLKPSWTFVEGRLVITLWPQAAKNLIAGLQAKTPRLADHPDYSAQMQRLRGGDPRTGNATVFWFDLRRLAGFVLDNGIPFAQSLIPRIEGMPVDFTDFPPTEVIVRHLSGVVAAGTVTDRGILLEALSPTGALPVIGGLAGATAVFLIPRRMAAEAAAESEFMVAAETSRARLDIERLETAVHMFLTNEGRLPKEDEWPDFLINGSKNHPEPYLDQQMITGGRVLDPWGSPYEYRKPSPREFEIISFGADGQPGGEGPAADISSQK